MKTINQFLELDSEERILRKIPDQKLSSEILSIIFCENKEMEDEFPVIFLDTETTGVDLDKDQIIEVSAIRCTVTRNKILSIDEYISMLEQPANLISNEIEKLTGISSKDVQGKSIDDNAVAKLLNDDPLIIAHQAKFDRQFFEKRFPNLDKFRWGCSANEVNWRAMGFESNKLEYLLFKKGWYYSPHRALNDALAIAFLFSSDTLALNSIIDAINQETCEIKAICAPFEVKDILKSRGYRWNPKQRVWFTCVQRVALEAEISFLENIYQSARKNADITCYTARERFK